MSSFNGQDNIGVYELITELCNKTASKCMQSKISQKQLAAKMRSHAYEIMLRKSKTEIPCSSGDPIKDLLSHHFESQKNVKNVAEYKRTVDLKNAITHIRTTDFGDGKDCVYNTLRVLIGLRNSVKDDLSEHLFQNPFSFGLLDEMLPKPNRETFGSPQPYPYFPSYMFDLPYGLKAQGAILDSQKSQSYTEYTVETFDSRSFLPENYSQHGSVGTKTFLSPMTLASMTSTCISPYSESTLLDYPRLTGPRDLKIPSAQSAEPNVKISLASTNVKLNVDEVYRAKTEACVDIWELATRVDKDVPLDIWEEVSKLPPINERQIIATSARELGLWRGVYNDMSDLNVISEKQFIRHIMYLIIGVETSSFLFNQESNCFYMKENLILEGISRERIKGYASTLLAVGTYYRRLYNFAFNQSLEDHFHTKGLIYEAAREEVRRYLLKFRLVATEIYEEFCKHISEDINCMPTLLQILYHLEPLKYEIETIASIYKMMNTDPKATLPYGAELMSYFFNEISLLTHKRTAQILFNSLFSVCKVYFKFIERFIFEGELDDRCHEFFIRKDIQYVNSRTKRYWDKGFHITLTVAVPEFLRPIASFILLCGKSLRLLKLCNPNDPLVVLISSDHPSVRCCASFEELERQQRVLDVYRTRCLFVSGEPVTFEQILLKREAERKAFAEMASLKQAETMEKIVAERKRLAQLIIAEKQHSLRVLEAAIAEAKAAKREAKQREKKRYALEAALEKATEEVNAKLKDVERDKMMEYYSKLNMAVEKSKIHTEWKIKRLQLDQSRMQLLSTEERNLKREKLELEHQRNEAVMQMSIQSVQSIDTKSDDDIFDDNDNGNNDNTPITATNMTDSTLSIEIKENPQKRDVATNKAKAESSSDVFSAICNVAKSIFGVSKTKEENSCDNDLIIDSQGNIVTQNINSNNDTTKFGTSSDVIGANLNEAFDNLRFLEMRQEALKNKYKVMSHEFGTDNENNEIKDQPPLIKLPSVDEENNVEDEWWPYAEARRNKMKVLGAEFGLVKEETKKNISEPRTEAQKEALINKQKVLGVEYNLPAEIAITREAVNVAQEEAIINKQKVLGVEYNLPAEIAVTREAANVAQEEAIINKQKVLGVEYNLPAEIAVTREAANVAQEEAIINKQKVLGVEYNLPAEIALTKEAANVAQEEAIINKQKVLGVEYNLPAKIALTKEAANVAQEEAIINKQKVLGVEYNLPAKIAVTREAANVVQEEAIINKKKVLGEEYNLPAEIATKRAAANVAQEEAIRNKSKILGSEYETGTKTVLKPSIARKSSLTLNLKPYGEASSNYAVTPSTGALTPGEFFSKLDLETPTTADMPADGAMTCDIFTPRSETSKDLESAKVMSDKNFLGSNGFNFPVVVDDDAAASEGLSEIQTEPSPQNSPSKTLDLCDAKDLCVRTSVFNILDGSYNLDNFDPFGVKDLQKFTKDFFSTRMDSSLSFYTHPAAIMEEVKKRPYNNIFTSHYDPEDEEEYKTGSDNIATLTTCLQRSVMLPLTYQLEVVNNSILTYFLVNLDMYEHLRSLKDYFFLMDGEFSRSICHNLFTKLTKTLNPQELLNFATLHNILDKALGSSISHIHKFSENLSFTITDSPLSFQHSSPDVLQCLSLTYSVSWPLNIILSQEALLRYARVFQFLIKMRRIFWVLNEDFESLKVAAKLSRPLLRSPHYISVQIYRHVMASLIRALDNYIVTTCILSSWTEFEKDLKKARTLDDLYECHVVYIKKVLFRCLLNNRSTPVMKLLNDIFTVILKFSRVLKSGEWQQKEPNGCFTHTSYVQLEELFHLFEKLAKYLHKVVTKLMECGYQRHLVELLTMVNLNGYYDHNKSKEDTNVTYENEPLENVRAIIFHKFRRRLQYFEELTSVFSDEAPCLRTLERWYLEFQSGHTSVSDKSRPKSAFTEDNIIAVRQLILEDRHVTYREIEALLGISGTTIQKILHEAHGVRKLHSLQLDTASAFRHKAARVRWCKKTLQRFNRGESTTEETQSTTSAVLTNLGSMPSILIPNNNLQSGSFKTSQSRLKLFVFSFEALQRRWWPRSLEKPVMLRLLHLKIVERLTQSGIPQFVYHKSLPNFENLTQSDASSCTTTTQAHAALFKRLFEAGKSRNS